MRRTVLLALLLPAVLPGCERDRPPKTPPAPAARSPFRVEQLPYPPSGAVRRWQNVLVLPGDGGRVVLGDTVLTGPADRPVRDGIRKDSVRARWLRAGELLWASWTTYGHGSGRFNVDGHLLLQWRDGRACELFRDHFIGFARGGWSGWHRDELEIAPDRDGGILVVRSQTSTEADKVRRLPLSRWTTVDGLAIPAYVRRITLRRVHWYRVLDGRLEHRGGSLVADLGEGEFPARDAAAFFGVGLAALRRHNPGLADTCSGRLVLATDLPPYRRDPDGRTAELSSDTWEAMRVVHVFIALCDNRHQGIVRVPDALGDGQEPATNLYWGARYGVRTFFGNSPHWVEVPLVRQPVNEAVLERCAFKGTAGGRAVWVVASAYDGRRMKAAIRDFLHAGAGQLGEEVTVRDGDVRRVIRIGGHANLVCLVGHNGFMDGGVPEVPRAIARGSVCRGVVLACRSRPDFAPRLRRLGCPSLITTTGLMAPEAYTLDAIVRAWAAGGSPDAVRTAAARAYSEYQKIGTEAALRLFAAEGR
jgi:hypothetical protein